MSVATAAKYDLTTNIDVTDGLTNGAECVIEYIDYRVENCTRPTTVLFGSHFHILTLAETSVEKMHICTMQL